MEKANSEFLKPNAVPHAQAKGTDALRKLLSLEKSSSDDVADSRSSANDAAEKAERPTVGDRVVSLHRKVGYRHGQGVCSGVGCTY